jgi:hypothetical protein
MNWSFEMSLFEPEMQHLPGALCGGDPVKAEQPRATAIQAVKARVEFRDGLLAVLPSHKNLSAEREATCLN